MLHLRLQNPRARSAAHHGIEMQRGSLSSRFSSQSPFFKNLSFPSKSCTNGRGRKLTVFAASRTFSKEDPPTVAIAGGGIGGLTLAKGLAEQGWKVQVFEKTAQFRRFGGPIQLASNALSTLRAFDETFFEKVMQKFTFTGCRTNGVVDGVRSEWYCAFDAIKDLPEKLGLPYTGVIDRSDLQELLVENLDDEVVQNETKVVGYERKADGGVTVKLEGGREMDFDALVGADGIWSSVRAQMWNEPERCLPYSGVSVYAGTTVMKTADYWETGYKVYIGPDKYFVTSDTGKGRIQWYVFLGGSPDDECPQKPIEALKAMFEGWCPEIHQVLDNTNPEEVQLRPLFERPPSVLKSWTDGCVTLLGDACHPMMPNLGQGGCQAIEDAFVLSQDLGGVKSSEDIQRVMRNYYSSRIVRTAIIQGLSRLAGDFTIRFFDTPSKVKSMAPLVVEHTSSWNSVVTALIKPLFPPMFDAQFAYLYSFRPSALGEGELKQLAAEERIRAEAQAKEAWLAAGVEH